VSESIVEKIMPQNEALLNEFDEEMKNTRKMLERIPDGKFEYKPHEKSMELGRLASHVAELPGWVKETLTLEVLEIQPGQKPFWAKTRQEILEAFDRNFVFVGVSTKHGRDTALMTGSAEVRESPETASVLAVLDATNRWLDR